MDTLQCRRPYAVIPDQIETGTLMIAAAATHGDVTICGCIPTHMEALTAKLLEMARAWRSATTQSASARWARTGR